MGGTKVGATKVGGIKVGGTKVGGIKVGGTCRKKGGRTAGKEGRCPGSRRETKRTTKMPLGGLCWERF